MQQRSAMDAVMSGAFQALNSTGFTGLSSLHLYRVPQGTTCPYALLQSPFEIRQDCFQAPGKQVTFQVHVVSVSPAAEPHAILNKAVELLHYSTSMAATAHTPMVVQYETGESYEETVDGVLYRHVVGMFRAQIWQTS